MRQLWEVLKIIVEPSGAVPYAALLAQRASAARPRIGAGAQRRQPRSRAAAVELASTGLARARSDALEDQRDALPDADAHGAQRIAAAAGCASCQVAVVASRAPDMPSGWPSAIAPPLGLTCAASSGKPQLAQHRERLAGERLVQLDHLELPER